MKASSKLRNLPFLLVLVLLAHGAMAANTEWDIHEEEGRDYVTLQNISDFYGFDADVPAVSQVSPISSNTPLTRKITLSKGLKGLEVTTNSRVVVLNGAKHWMAFPALIRDDQVLISRLDLVKTIEPALRPQSVSGYPKVKTVVLDAGHGGHDKGAHSPYGYEKNFALDVAKRVKGLLEKRGFNVVMTRETDEFIPLHTRAKIANKYPDAIFVSIHFNSSLENRLASGFEVFSCTPRGGPSTADEQLRRRDFANENGNANDIVSAVLANSIHHAAIGQIPVMDRGVKDARFAVLRLTKIPAVLFEGGFVSNTVEAKKIASPAWRQQLASAIATGIGEFKQVADTRTPPRLVAEYRQENGPRVTLRDRSPTVITSADASGKTGTSAEPTVTLPVSK